MSGTTLPPYLQMVAAIAVDDVVAVAELSAMRTAVAVVMANGGALAENEPAPSAEERTARLALARKVIARQIDRQTIVRALILIPECSQAVAADPSNPATSLASVDLLAAWARNWTDYARLFVEG